jgi:hypothetical protein
MLVLATYALTSLAAGMMPSDMARARAVETFTTLGQLIMQALAQPNPPASLQQCKTKTNYYYQWDWQ